MGCDKISNGLLWWVGYKILVLQALDDSRKNVCILLKVSKNLLFVALFLA
jgi:hypothetical protein